MRLVKYYADFVMNIVPSEIASKVKNIYVKDDGYMALAEGVIYVYLDDKVSICAVIEEENEWDFSKVQQRVFYSTGIRCAGRMTMMVFETSFVTTGGPMFLDMVHHRVAQRPPTGIVINIHEPCINNNLLIKFSAYKDGFTATFHIHEDGRCIVSCDTRRCVQSIPDDVCKARVHFLKVSIEEYTKG